MGYVFRLKKIADLNVQRQKKLKIEFSREMMRLQDAVELLNTYISKERDIMDYLKRMESNSSLSALEYQYSYKSLEGVREDIAAQYDVVRKIQEDVDRIRQELVKISQDVKMLDKLDEKCYKEYIDNLTKIEQKNIDQFICNRYKIKKVI